MTKNLSLFLAMSLRFTTVIGARAVDSTLAATSTADRTRVIETMRSMFVTLADDDLAKFHAIAAPDFLVRPKTNSSSRALDTSGRWNLTPITCRPVCGSCTLN
jgi:hypothetical protein